MIRAVAFIQKAVDALKNHKIFFECIAVRIIPRPARNRPIIQMPVPQIGFQREIKGGKVFFIYIAVSAESHPAQSVRKILRRDHTIPLLSHQQNYNNRIAAK